MSAIDLNKFTKINDARVWMSSLFDLDGYLGATNGSCLVVDTSTKSTFYGFPKFENLINPANKRKLQSQIHLIVQSPERFNWVALPDTSGIKHKDCDNCDRRGMEMVFRGECPECNGNCTLTFENDHNSYDVECKSCSGRGEKHVGWQVCSICEGTKKHFNYIRIEQDGLGNKDWCLNAESASRLSILPNCEIAWVEEWERFMVRCDNGAGIVFPMRR